MSELPIVTPKYFQNDPTRTCPFDACPSVDARAAPLHPVYCLLQHPYLTRRANRPDTTASPICSISECANKVSLSNLCHKIAQLKKDIQRGYNLMSEETGERVCDTLNLISTLIEHSFAPEDAYRFVADELDHKRVNQIKDLIGANQFARDESLGALAQQPGLIQSVKAKAAEKGVL
jgi:hypothetical protein